MGRVKMSDSFQRTEKFWKKRIEAASVTHHSTTRGDIAENAWRDLLGEYLPARYRVNSGFVIGVDGKISSQIDCVIYDNTYTPTFLSEHGVYYIPAEGVYAVFEVKQEVTRKHILYAANKAATVRSLRKTSAPYVGDGQERPAKPHLYIIGGLLASRISGWGTHAQTMTKQQPRGADQTPKGIDIILTAEMGGADFFERGFPANKPKIYSGQGGLMLGVLRLIHALQTQGTVPAVDWNEWISRQEAAYLGNHAGGL